MVKAHGGVPVSSFHLCRSHSLHSVVNVGILGLGSAWDSRYLPALRKLGRRIRVCAVYDPVAGLAEQVAAEQRAVAVQGVTALLRRSDVRALLLLDAGWYGGHLLKLLCRGDKPVYVVGSLGEDLDELDSLHQAATRRGLTVMPEFSRRYTPSTSRLQELMATRIGRPRRVTIDAVLPRPDDPNVVPGQGPGTEFLVGLFDWCRYVVGTPPRTLQARCPDPGHSGAGDAPQRITITFAQSRSGGEAPVVDLQLREAASQAGNPVEAPLCFDLECERGRARLDSPTTITWATGEEDTTETLTSERSEVEVMLDHFCRRAVGGLIPVADIQDVCRSVKMAHAVEESLRTGRPLALGVHADQ